MMRKPVGNPGMGRFVVGVDFGTTFTSVAFAHSGSPDDVKMIQTWPNGSSSGESADQVPTEVHYTRLRTPREFLWGNEVPPASKKTPEPLRWFKLLLQNSAKATGQVSGGSLSDRLQDVIDGMNSLPRIVSDDPSGSATPAHQTSARLRSWSLKPATVVEDFLSGVRKVAYQSIEDSYGKQFVSGSKIEYIVTIPAIWSDAAKAAMVRACEAAGFGAHRAGFHLVSEPEAAAAHTLKVIQPNDLRANDTFIICDAGGGTVDLISYKIRSLKPKLAIDEVVSGSGGLCGSVYLDDGFRQYIEKTLGKAVVDKMSAKSRANMEKSWREGVKFRFTGSKAHNMLYDVAVNGLPDNEELEIEDGFHTMSPESVQAIFDPIVNKIVDLVNQQVTAVEEKKGRVAAIMLVGGFGSSKYLFECLQAAKFGKNKQQIEVLQPPNAKTAIARGALIRGLDGSCVKERCSRLFYGVSANATFEDRPRGQSRMYYDPVDGIHRVPGTMFWYINKEDIFSENYSHSSEFYRAIPVWAPNFKCEDTILASADDTAPEFMWEKGANVYKVGTLVADLSRIPRSTIPTMYGRDGIEYYRVTYNIKCTMINEVLRFELVYNGISYGEANLVFEEES